MILRCSHGPYRRVHPSECHKSCIHRPLWRRHRNPRPTRSPCGRLKSHSPRHPKMKRCERKQSAARAIGLDQFSVCFVRRVRRSACSAWTRSGYLERRILARLTYWEALWLRGQPRAVACLEGKLHKIRRPFLRLLWWMWPIDWVCLPRIAKVGPGLLLKGMKQRELAQPLNWEVWRACRKRRRCLQRL